MLEPDSDDAVADGPLGFCVVANVAAETWHGDCGLDVRSGVEHFFAGSKVWALPPQWGDGGVQVMVVGHHRGTRGRGHVRIVVPRRHLTNFRVQAIYKRSLFRALVASQDRYPEVPRLWASRDEAERFAARGRKPAIEARLPDFPFSIEVSGPPPMTLRSGGRVYYLAHFNANRAIYSSDPPPAEG